MEVERNAFKSLDEVDNKQSDAASITNNGFSIANLLAGSNKPLEQQQQSQQPQQHQLLPDKLPLLPPSKCFPPPLGLFRSMPSQLDRFLAASAQLGAVKPNNTVNPGILPPPPALSIVEPSPPPPPPPPGQMYPNNGNSPTFSPRSEDNYSLSDEVASHCENIDDDSSKNIFSHFTLT